MSIFLANKVMDLEATVKALIARVEELERHRTDLMAHERLVHLEQTVYAFPAKPEAPNSTSQTLSRRHAR